MIQLRSDCLVFEVSGGDKIPCSVEKLTIEVLADSMEDLDPEVVRHAAAAVLHYFKDDLGRESVTLDEFTKALEHVLTGLGYQVAGAAGSVEVDGESATVVSTSGGEVDKTAECNLGAMADALGDGLELNFFPRLRTELKSLLEGQPRLVRFNGLRQCAKRLARTRRWCARSVQVSDEIVGFLRDCWGAERPRRSCSLLVD